MKKLLFILAVVALASCQQKKLDRMQTVQDSLMTVAHEKDSTITDFIGTMNEIQANLDTVKKIQDIVNVESKTNAEPSRSSKDKILNDIATINNLLQKNKELVASQKKKLNYSSYKMKEMRQMLDRMTKQLNQKDTEIAQLRSELEKLHINISDLNKNLTAVKEKADQQAKMLEEKSSTIDMQTTEINTAYYVFGTAKELVENGIVERQGGFLGIGRSLKFRKDFNPDLFTKIDIREVKEINLNAKKAKVITTHPIGSYKLVGEDPIEKIEITDPAKFWKTSKYLVIVVD
ncbi:MAG TPA: hypothetical protein VKA27_00560 [Sunxiuqinia sp.]|nr:hypothetical protein [Sunxiuqinia sp.]